MSRLFLCRSLNFHLMPCNWALTVPLLPGQKIGGNDLLICGYSSTPKGPLCTFSFLNAMRQKQSLSITSLGTTPYSKMHINYHKTIMRAYTLLYLTYSENSCNGISCIFPSSFVCIFRDLHSFLSPCKGRDIPGIYVCITMVT